MCLCLYLHPRSHETKNKNNHSYIHTNAALSKVVTAAVHSKLNRTTHQTTTQCMAQRINCDDEKEIECIRYDK